MAKVNVSNPAKFESALMRFRVQCLKEEIVADYKKHARFTSEHEKRTAKHRKANDRKKNQSDGN